VVLILLSVKTNKERFPSYHCFHSKLSLSVSTNMVLKRYLACWTFTKC